MYDTYPEDNWSENANGNYVCTDDYGELLATVFCVAGSDLWQIVINRDEGGAVVADEYFDDASDAMRRADDVLGGAHCILTHMGRPQSKTTGWREQKTRANGAPTFGRESNGQGVSVKMATSGKWYSIEHAQGSRPQGWFDSAQDAMEAYDGLHP